MERAPKQTWTGGNIRASGACRPYLPYHLSSYPASPSHFSPTPCQRQTLRSPSFLSRCNFIFEFYAVVKLHILKGGAQRGRGRALKEVARHLTKPKTSANGWIRIITGCRWDSTATPYPLIPPCSYENWQAKNKKYSGIQSIHDQCNCLLYKHWAQAHPGRQTPNTLSNFAYSTYQAPYTNCDKR